MELTKPSTLALYSPDANSKIRPVAYVFRGLSDTKQHYFQIEKEALGQVWACEKFSDYIIGGQYISKLIISHLYPFTVKPILDQLLPQIVRFRLCLMQFNYTISHVPGKMLYTADILSHAPVDAADKTALIDAESEMLVQLSFHNYQSAQIAWMTSAKLNMAILPVPNYLYSVKKEGQVVMNYQVRCVIMLLLKIICLMPTIYFRLAIVLLFPTV